MSELVSGISIQKFCKAYGIARGSWYNLKERDEAPEHFNIGRRVVIPLEAVRRWEEVQRDKAQRGASA